ncbi:Esterase TesA precursor [Chromobacterium violaceum]|uniref:Esterase TesA n=1 Tax=Chromobacterium violaceum TaxID=536 RepID=A0A3S4HUG3_CHRVL|nr:Esterase TesA precursor [Chromobacterium violaceum]
MAAAALAATVLVFGDSLSAGYGLAPGQGWAALLARDLSPRHKVVNASVSGETSAGGLSRLPTRSPATSPTCWCWNSAPTMACAACRWLT